MLAPCWYTGRQCMPNRLGATTIWPLIGTQRLESVSAPPVARNDCTAQYHFRGDAGHRLSIRPTPATLRNRRAASQPRARRSDQSASRRSTLAGPGCPYRGRCPHIVQAGWVVDASALYFRMSPLAGLTNVFFRQFLVRPRRPMRRGAQTPPEIRPSMITFPRLIAGLWVLVGIGFCVTLYLASFLHAWRLFGIPLYLLTGGVVVLLILGFDMRYFNRRR